MSSVAQKINLPKINLPPSLNKIVAVFRREFLDHRAGYFTVPMVITGLIILGMIAQIYFASAGSIQFSDNGETFSDLINRVVSRFDEAPTGAREIGMMGIAIILYWPLWIVVNIVIVFALLRSLYSDRRDKSFLFWKSMPISDTMEIAIKYCAAVFVAPAISMGFGIVLQLFFGVVATGFVWSTGGSAWDLIWSPMPIVTFWPELYLHFVVLSLWIFPIFAWLMLASSFAPRTPLMFAAVPPIVLVIVEEMIFDTSYILDWLGEQFGMGYASSFSSAVESAGYDGLDFDDMDFESEADGIEFFSNFLGDVGPFDVLAGALSQGSFYFGLAIGAAFIGGAIWLRKNRV